MNQCFADPASVAGAAVAVVKDGVLLFQRGYGVADVQTRQPTVPDRTLFRIGSVSKLVTWTAVMQAWERGRLGPAGLDADVNTLLGPALRIPATFPEPVRVWNLMTHTGGFEQHQLGHQVKPAPDPTSLVDALVAHMPARVRPPASESTQAHAAAYSGWCTALAGHVVATTSGLDFDDYVEREIFAPLGMTRSTFREPLPPGWADDMASGHEPGPTGLEARGFEYLHTLAPDGSMTSTAGDMARFMLAHLEGGQNGQGRILMPDTLQRMHARSLAAHEAMNGATLGFCEWHLNGRRWLVHAGTTLYFSALLCLVPDERAGFFLAFNTRIVMTPEALTARLADLFFPARVPPLASPAADVRPTPRGLAGTYFNTPHSHTRIDKALLLVDADASTVRVRITGAGTLRMENALGPGSSEWVAVPGCPDLFLGGEPDAAPQALAKFLSEGPGRPPYLALPMPFAPAYRLRPWQTPQLHMALLQASVAVFVLVLAIALACGLNGSATAAASELAWGLAGLASLINMTALTVAWHHLEDPLPLLYRFPVTLRLAVWAPAVSSLPLTAAGVALAAWALVGDSGLQWAWLYGCWIAVSVLFFLSLHHWNLLGPRFA